MGWNLYCHRCYGRISGSYFNTTLGHHFHKHCFKCDACCTALQDHGFYILDEGYYCPRDFDRLWGSQENFFHGYYDEDGCQIGGKFNNTNSRSLNKNVERRNKTKTKMEKKSATSKSVSTVTQGENNMRNNRYSNWKTCVIYGLMAFCI